MLSCHSSGRASGCFLRKGRKKKGLVLFPSGVSNGKCTHVPPIGQSISGHERSEHGKGDCFLLLPRLAPFAHVFPRCLIILLSEAFAKIARVLETYSESNLRDA